MKMPKYVAVVALVGALSGAGAFAQSQSAPAANANQPILNEVNYVDQLPNPSELSKNEAPAGARLSKITQTSGTVTVTYTYADGHTYVVAYELLADAGNARVAQAPAPSTTLSPTVVQPSSPPPPVYYSEPAPTVVYQEAPPVYYDSPSYYSYPWFPPIALSLGFAFHGGHGFAGYHGGYRGGWGGGFHRR